MKTILPILSAIIFTATARADEQVISTFSWKELADAGKLTAGTLTGAPDNALKIENGGQGPLSATVLTIVQPKITTDFYAVTGEVRYDNVAGDGFLEMWSHFGETTAYFSRTLGVAGPMAKLTGTSGWRTFTLPFNAKGTSSPPSKLVVNAFLAMPIDDTVLAYAQAMQPVQFIGECPGVANRKSEDGGFEFAPGFRRKATLILAHLICDEDFSRQGWKQNGTSICRHAVF
jgi:hypothetical protein